MKRVRFRTLGCYPLTGAIESTATTLPEIIQEMLLATHLRAAGPGDRPRRGGLDGAEEEGRVLLMADAVDTLATTSTAYLAQHERKELLRFLTCGSVDDGKSTLIGRLLLRHQDDLRGPARRGAARQRAKHGTTGGEIDLALLTDGLKAEREQGITIDVAYRYFSTAERKFIIADCPGHEQYTRNMATGASTCDLAIILIDARHGVHAADPAALLHRLAAGHQARRRRRQQDGPRRLLARRSSSGSRTTTPTSSPGSTWPTCTSSRCRR